jgi:NADPH:quinone reductase
MRLRVLDGMTTTFASHYTARITLEQALEPETVAVYMRKSTRAKYLLTPQQS